MRKTQRLLRLALLLAVLLGSTHAWAQAPQTSLADLLQGAAQAMNSGHAADAVPLYEQALVLEGASQDRASQGTTLNDLGLAYDALNRYDKAIEMDEQALSIEREEKNRAGEGTTLSNLGLVYHHLQRYDKAISWYQQALVAEREVKNRFVEGVTLNLLGEAYDNLSDESKAIEAYEQALAIKREAKDRPGEGLVLNNLGYAYNNLSRYDQAIECYNQALTIKRQVQDRAGEASVLNNLGMAYANLSRAEKAIEEYEQALALEREVKSPSGEASVLNNLGGAYDDLSRYDKAIEYYQQALAIRKAAQDRTGSCTTLSNLGVAYAHLNRFDRAAEYYQQALVVEREIKNRFGEGAVLNNLGEAYDSLRHYDKAIESYQQSLALRREIQDRAGEGTTLGNLGVTYQHRGQYVEAVETFTQALAIHREVKNRAAEGITLNNLGYANEQMNRYETAVAYYEPALSIEREVKDRAGEGTTLASLMDAWKKRKAPDLAIYYGKLSVDAAQDIRGHLQGLEAESRKGFVASVESRYRTLAGLLIGAGRLAEAQLVLELLKGEELRDVTRGAPLGQTLPLTPAEQALAAQYQQVSGQVEALGEERARLTAAGHPTETEKPRLKQVEADLDVADRAFQQFLKSLEPTFTGTARSARLDNLKSLQDIQEALQELGPGTVVVYTLLDQNAYRAVLLTANAPPKSITVPIDVQAVKQQIVTFRLALQNPSTDPRPAGEALYRVLVAPLEADLQQAGAHTIMWELDDVLRYVPFNALYNGKAYLIETYCNVMLTTAGREYLTKEPAASWSAAGMGVSLAYAGFAPLTGVPSELRSVVRSRDSSDGVLAGDVLLDRDFTEEALKAVPDHHYTVLHLATHFNFDATNPAASFLLLGDGSHLDVDHIKTLSFRGVDLLTLSACDTATGKSGDGREFESFAMLAQQRGAKAVVATLWPVSDVSTPTLMRAFYRMHQDAPQRGKGEALRQAQLALLQGTSLPSPATPAPSRGAERLDAASGTYPRDPARPYAHPFYWAPFILIGNFR